MLTKFEEDGSLTKFISVQELADLSKRVQYKTFGEQPENIDSSRESELIVDDKYSLDNFIKNDLHGKLETPLDKLHNTLFLISCYISTTDEGIKYLLKKGVEINRTNIAGNNALIMLIGNKNMALENKLKIMQRLINRGIDINFPNQNFLTPLAYAINSYELEIANFLIDNGGYVLFQPEEEIQSENIVI